MPSRSRSGFVTKRSSPTSCRRSPSCSVVARQPSQSSSALPSSSETSGKRVGEVAVEAGHLLRGELAPLEAVAAVGEELARGGVESDRHPVAMARPLGGVEDRLDGDLARLEVGREAALVADTGREPALHEQLLQLVVRLRRDPQAVREAVRSRRDEHELLQIDRVVGVDAAVDHVEHRYRQRRRALAAQVAEERDAGVGRRSLRARERDAEDGVRAEAALVRRPVELDQAPVDRFLVRGVEPGHRVRDLAVDVRNGRGDALPVPRTSRRPAARPPHGRRWRRRTGRSPSPARRRPPRPRPSGCRGSRGPDGRGPR